MVKITQCLWFDNQAEQAAKFYTSIFKNSKILNVLRYGDSGAGVAGKPKGSIMTISFKLGDQEFISLNGGPTFKFNESMSFVVHCDTQEEIDYYWAKLSEAGDKNAQQCGWLKDKFGISWQIIPSILDKLLHDSDKKKSERVMKAVLQMKKLDIKRLKDAYEIKR